MDCQRPRFLQKMENFDFATKITPRVVNYFALIKTARTESQKGRRKSRPPFLLLPKRSRKVVRFFLMEARTGTPVQRSAFSSR
jgi:hypothetical protein